MVLTSRTGPEPIDVLATNIHGMGATRLAEALLPALERVAGTRLERLWLPGEGPLSRYGHSATNDRYRRYRRVLPKALSRVFECTVLSARLGRGRTVLTLGDLPIRSARRQVVFVQTPFVLQGRARLSLPQVVKSLVSRVIFKANLSAIDAAIVQTETMRVALIATYPKLAGKVAVIGQPAPPWLAARSVSPRPPGDGKLRLFFPAARYPHKNHALLERLSALLTAADGIALMNVTIDPPIGAQSQPPLRYLGTLGPEQMMEHYAASDALVFPSLEESYGLPLVEAMVLGLPIVVADRAYARELCGEGAIYFDPLSAEDLRAKLAILNERLRLGWRPDWTSQLAKLPQDWDEVARRMLAVIDEGVRADGRTESATAASSAA